MARQIIAVGSTRGPKLDATRDALKEFASLLAPNDQFEIMGFDVESGVRHTPLSSADSMRGAQQRAHTLMSMSAKQHETYSYYVGLEGGLEVLASPDLKPTCKVLSVAFSWKVGPTSPTACAGILAAAAVSNSRSRSHKKYWTTA